MTEITPIETPYSSYEPLFGSWYITEELGGGAAGQLYRIQRVDAFGNEFSDALKVISIPAGGEDEIRSVLAKGVAEDELQSYYEGIISSVSREFTILERLKGSTNIVDYSDHAIIPHEDSFGWDILIRMELITPLLDYTRDHEPGPDDVLAMGADLCRALALCQKNDIIHRDIKPENLFISDAGDYKLGDFGIARIDSATHNSFSRKGTFPYMAPEVYRGESYGRTVDLYSLGLVMYQQLNHGRLPFMPSWPEPVVYEDTEQAFAERITDHAMQPPMEGSDELKAIVLKACSYHPEDRYQTAEEMLADLEELQHEGKLKALPKTGLAAAKRAKARRRKILVGVLAALLVLGAVCYGLFPHHVTDIKGIEQNTTLLLDEKLAPEYKVTPARFRDEPITFASSNEAVFTVDENGQITAVGVGSGVLTIEAESYTREVQIVVEPKVTAITGVESSMTLTAGDTKTLRPKLTPEEYAKEPITYKSGDKDVFTVSDKGVIKAVGPGSAKLTISAGGFVFTADVDVNAKKSSSGGSQSTHTTTAPASYDDSSDGVFDSSEDEYF